MINVGKLFVLPPPSPSSGQPLRMKWLDGISSNFNGPFGIRNGKHFCRINQARIGCALRYLWLVGNKVSTDLLVYSWSNYRRKRLFSGLLQFFGALEHQQWMLSLWHIMPIITVSCSLQVDVNKQKVRIMHGKYGNNFGQSPQEESESSCRCEDSRVAEKYLASNGQKKRTERQLPEPMLLAKLLNHN